VCESVCVCVCIHTGDAREGFSAAVSDDGCLLMFGHGSQGQLGNGRFQSTCLTIEREDIYTVISLL